MEIGNNFYNYNVDYFSRAQEQKQTQVKEENREDDTRSLEKNESSSLEKSENKEENKSNTELSAQEKIDLAELKARDTQVRAHEAAHQSGPAASGGATFTYQKGPDGVMYAVGGEVPVRIQTGSTPQETISNLQGVIATALAPADPSPQDISIASKARVMMMKAQQEFAQEIQEKLTKQEEYTQNAKKEYETNETQSKGQDLSYA